MEKRVVFRDRQELQSVDMNNAQVYASEALEHVVADALIETSRRYTGFTVTQDSATAVNVALGRLYQGGEVYSSAGDVALSLYSYLPVATKRVIGIVVWGQQVDTDVQPRDFLIDLQAGTTEPQAVAMQKFRKAEVNPVPGTESADPQSPAIPDNTVLVALVTLTPTGIEAIEQVLGNRLANAETNQRDIAALNTWRNRTGPQIEALSSDLAALAERTDGKADLETVVRMAGDIARLKDKVGLPDSYAQYGADFFVDATETDTALTAGGAVVDSGILFPNAASVLAALALFNPIDGGVWRGADGLTLPAFDHALALQTTGYAGDLALSQYQVQTHTLTKYVEQVYRLRYGRNWNWLSSWHAYRSRQYRDAGLWWQLRHRTAWGVWESFPVERYRIDTATESYNGVMVAQTILAPRAMWLTRIGLYFTAVAAAGDVKIAVVDVENGKPVLSKTRTSATVTATNLKKYPVETRIDVPPVLLESGRRYAIVVITGGAHRAAVVAADSYTAGTLFYGSDGEYFAGDLTKDLMFSLYAAAFRRARTETVLQNVSLAGGITELDIAAKQVVPEGSELTYEVQVSGRWYPLADEAILATAPDIVPLRVVMVGTRDVAPGFVRAADVITASRPALALAHVSKQRTLAAATNTVQVELTLSAWDAAKHTVVAKLVKADASEVTASLVETATVDEGGETATKKTFHFTGLAGITAYRVKITGTRTSDSAPFAVAERVDVAI